MLLPWGPRPTSPRRRLRCRQGRALWAAASWANRHTREPVHRWVCLSTPEFGTRARVSVGGSGCRAATTPPRAAAERLARIDRFKGSVCAAVCGATRRSATSSTTAKQYSARRTAAEAAALPFILTASFRLRTRRGQSARRGQAPSTTRSCPQRQSCKCRPQDKPISCPA
jgi:hypothetical protein